MRAKPFPVRNRRKVDAALPRRSQRQWPRDVAVGICNQSRHWRRWTPFLARAAGCGHGTISPRIWQRDRPRDTMAERARLVQPTGPPRARLVLTASIAVMSRQSCEPASSRTTSAGSRDLAAKPMGGNGQTADRSKRALSDRAGRHERSSTRFRRQAGPHRRDKARDGVFWSPPGIRVSRGCVPLGRTARSVRCQGGPARIPTRMPYVHEGPGLPRGIR